MRLTAPIAAALAAVVLLSGPSIAGERLTGEAKLAKMLEGRQAGQPQSCINTFVNREAVVIDGTAVVYGRGRTIWVNRTAHPSDLDNNDAMVMRLHGSQLCRQDIVTTIDTSSGIYTGNVFLTEFVPYTRTN